MAIFTFFKTPKPKGFKYKPIYYNEQKEEMKEREARIKKELGLNDSDTPFVPNIKGRFRSPRMQKYSQSRQTSVRFLIILFALLLLAYYFFFR
jgi:hypothetical protein